MDKLEDTVGVTGKTAKMATKMSSKRVYIDPYPKLNRFTDTDINGRQACQSLTFPRIIAKTNMKTNESGTNYLTN